MLNPLREVGHDVLLPQFVGGRDSIYFLRHKAGVMRPELRNQFGVINEWIITIPQCPQIFFGMRSNHAVEPKIGNDIDAHLLGFLDAIEPLLARPKMAEGRNR